MRKFKDIQLRDVYEFFLEEDPLPETRGRGACHNAYYVGRYVNQQRPFAVRGSVAYAAWAAGVDNARAAARAADRIS